MYTVLIILPSMLLAVYCAAYPEVGHAESVGRSTFNGSEPSGIVSGLNGQAAGVIPGSGASRDLGIGDRVAIGEEIRVGPAGALEILWERRALFSLEERTKIVVQESKNGSALLEVMEGTVQVAYSYNEGHPTDILKIETPGARAVLRGGILEAKVEPVGVASNHAQVAKRGHDAGRASEVLRVIEGQAQVELGYTGAQPVLLKAGYEFSVSSGGSDAVRPSVGNGARKLAAVHGHQHVPDPTIQRVVRVHVEHALELERALKKHYQDGDETEGSAAGIKGTIVATSLGIPLSAISGPGGLIATSVSVPTVPPGPVSGGLGPIAAPPVPGGAGPIAAPPVPVPIVQAPDVTALTPSQSGGINSQSLLRDVLQDVTRGLGHGRGRDKD